MRPSLLCTIVAAALLLPQPAHADVRLVIVDGRVTVSATNATPRQILLEWARVGQTRVVNADRLTGPPMSIELTNVPEAQALDTLLRSAGGYVAAPRPDALPNASRFDRIYILATSSPARPAAPSQPPPLMMQPGTFAPAGDEPAGDPAVRAVPGAQPGANGPRPPAFAAFPQAQPIQPRVDVPQPPPSATQPPSAPPAAPAAAPAPAQPSPVPGSAAPGGGPVIGVSRPGLPVPVPAGQPQPGTPQR